ncbi:MAG: aldehyde dehydrogenase family protein [Chloroflexi bacterium]|nr:aldehyde dehydrogenase family protein [Chloroflexota bacterium]
MAKKDYHNYIDGRWVPARSGKTFENTDPASGEYLGTYPRSSPEDIEQAVDASVKAYDSWRKTPAPHRANILARAAEALDRKKDEVARSMTREMGKVLKEARGDVQEGIDMLQYSAGEGRRLFGHVTPSELPRKLALAQRVPVGVVAAITPWNFPLAIPTWKLGPALVAGNTVVFKPSQYTPESAYHLAKALEEAGLPPGVMNLVYGPGNEAGTPLIEHPRVDMVSFTGSSAVGQGIGQRCAHLGKRYHLEMGGKNAIIILEDADIDLALSYIIWSAFGTSGQRCTAASRIIVHKAVIWEVTERVVEATRKLRLGHGLEPETDVGPVVNAEQLEKVQRYVKIGIDEGAKVLCGGQRATEGALSKGYFFQPTIFGDVKPKMRIAQEEIFGPATAILEISSVEEAVAVNNDTPYGLVTGIFTRDINKALAALEDLSTGIVYINAGTIGAEVHLPFGGTRGTGNGHREAGLAALEVYTEWKSVYLDYSGTLQKAQKIE